MKHAKQKQAQQGNKRGRTARWAWGTAALLLLLTLALAACSNDGGNDSSGKPAATNAPAASGSGNAAGGQSDSGGDPQQEVGYPSTISYWKAMTNNESAVMTNLNEMALYQQLEKLTGTKIDFKHPAAGQGTEQFNLMIASRNLPDVIETNWLKVPRGPQNAIKEGTILRLNELIDQHAPNFKKFLQENPDVDKTIRTDEGDIYAFPFIRSDERQMVYNGPALRKDWLDKLGLPEPTTIAEWEETLIAFRDGDPNGNGQKDEIPFLLNMTDVKSAKNAIIGAWGILAQFYQVDGKVYYGEMQPAYREFIALMQRWYADGLIDPDFAAVDTKLMDAKMTGHTLGLLYMNAGSTMGKYLDLMVDDPTFDLFSLLPPVLNKGERSAAGQKDASYPGDGSAAVSASAKEPEKIVRWLDVAYGEQGHNLFNFGVEGESYEWVDGEPVYTEAMLFPSDGLTSSQALSKYIRGHSSGPFVQDVRGTMQNFRMQQQKDAVERWAEADNQLQLPPLTLTAEESGKVASVMNEINTYSEEMVTKMIMGEEPIEKFDQFVENLKKFGIEEVVAVQQAALDRYLAR